ncbi:hypothetical protein CRUP_006317 [Coryphaenoides rupestris]|nr:hypothetical protein CRUP_006317 [Coryphaenoides rupestris]
MFGFHKPKMYRSLDGCCICRAKSSSSRFTDSKRYEKDFTSCFGLCESRTGDICNACVLLVKRWKKLPVGSKKNWNHSPSYSHLSDEGSDTDISPGQKVCCGIIYKGRFGEVLIDSHLFKPCCRKQQRAPPPAPQEQVVEEGYMEDEEDEEEVEEASMSEVKAEGAYPEVVVVVLEEEVVVVKEDELRSCEVNAGTMQQLLAAV